MILIELALKYTFVYQIAQHLYILWQLRLVNNIHNVIGETNDTLTDVMNAPLHFSSDWNWSLWRNVPNLNFKNKNEQIFEQICVFKLKTVNIQFIIDLKISFE